MRYSTVKVVRSCWTTMYRRITFTKSPPFYMTTFSAVSQILRSSYISHVTIDSM